MAKTYIAKAKERAKLLLTSPICGNTSEDTSVERAINYVASMRFWPHETELKKFWQRVLKELITIENKKAKGK